jgi:hypothetical protein
MLGGGRFQHHKTRVAKLVHKLAAKQKLVLNDQHHIFHAHAFDVS